MPSAASRWLRIGRDDTVRRGRGALHRVASFEDSAPALSTGMRDQRQLVLGRELDDEIMLEPVRQAIGADLPAGRTRTHGDDELVRAAKARGAGGWHAPSSSRRASAIPCAHGAAVARLVRNAIAIVGVDECANRAPSARRCSGGSVPDYSRGERAGSGRRSDRPRSGYNADCALIRCAHRRPVQRRVAPHCMVVNLVRSGRKQPKRFSASAGGTARHLFFARQSIHWVVRESRRALFIEQSGDARTASRVRGRTYHGSASSPTFA